MQVFASKIFRLTFDAFGLFAVLCAVADGAPPKPAAASAKEKMERWWVDLEKSEPDASRALLHFSTIPNEAVPFFKEKLRPLKIDPKQVKALLVQLSSEKPEVWKPAFEDLEYLDPRLAIDLESLMDIEMTDSPGRQRLVAVLSERDPATLEGQEISLRPVGDDGFNFFKPEMGSFWAEHKVSRLNNSPGGTPKRKWTRAIRAMVLLKHIGTPEAIAILKEMSTGHPEAQPTKVAKELLAEGTSP